MMARTHPIGGLPLYLEMLTETERRQYLDAVERRLEGALPMAFAPEADASDARVYFEATTPTSPS